MAMLQKLDRIDVHILARLQENGRITNVELADAVGLSASPCLKRVKRLEKQGYIESYNAKINISKLLNPTLVFTEFTLKKHQSHHFDIFERGINKIEAVVECHLISGGYDYLAKFCCASVAHYQKVIESILQLDLGIERYFSYIVIKSPVNDRQVQLDQFIRDEHA